MRHYVTMAYMRSRKITWFGLLLIVSLMFARYRPIKLEQAALFGEHFTHDILHINLVRAEWNKDHSGIKDVLPATVITDIALIDDVVSLLSGQTMTRRLRKKGTLFYPNDFERPTFIVLFLVFEDNKSTIISIAPHPSLQVNGTRYRLWGQGIDTVKLWELLSGANPLADW